VKIWAQIKKVHIKNYIPIRNKGVNILEHNQPKGIKPKNEKAQIMM